MRFFHENSLINYDLYVVLLVTLEIRTLKPNRFKNQSSDRLKLLDQNCNHRQGFIKQETVALYYCGFKLKFHKHLL